MRIVIIYLVVGTLWVLGIDLLLNLFLRDDNAYSILDAIQAWAFVLLSGVLLYALIRWGMSLISRDAAARLSAEDALRRRNAELDALYETTLGLVDRLDRNSLLDAIVARAASLVGTDHAYLYVIEKGDAGEERLVIRAGVGRFEKQIGYTLRRGEGVGGRVWETGRIVSVDDYMTWPGRSRDLDWLEIHALVGIPLLAHGEVVGVIGLGYFEEDRPIEAEDISLLERFGKLASLTLENARLYAAARQELAERRQAEAALISSEGRYRMLMEHAGEGIFVIDLEGTFLDVNSCGCEMLGYTRHELDNLTVASILAPGETLRNPPRTEELMRGRVVVNERRMLRKDGTTFMAEITSSLLPDGRLQGIVHDVTERKAYEQRLEEQAVNQTELLSQLLTAQEAERRRLSMELHDGPLQSLGVSLLALDRIIRRHERNEYEIAAEELQAAREIIMGIVVDVRAVLSDLSLDLLTSYGLGSALRDHIERFSEVTGIEVSLDFPIEERLPPYIELLMYRLAQESLANVRKHSGATHVDIYFALEDSKLTMTISDNGKGFDVSRSFERPRAGERIGLASMRQRIRDAHGDMTIDSSDGKGTTLTFWCPVPAHAHIPVPAEFTDAEPRA
jgi:PAS domain S-box-containing protein